jgi:hypothetical protein
VPAQGSQNYQYEVLKAAQPLLARKAVAEFKKLRPVEKARIVPGNFKNADALLKAVKTSPQFSEKLDRSRKARRPCEYSG